MTHGTTGYRQKCRCDICKEANNTYMKLYYHRKLKGTEKLRLYRKEYNVTHKEERRGYNNKHREEYNKASSNWKKRNMDKVLASNRNRKHLIRATKSIIFTEKDLQLKLSMWSGCWVCGGVKEQIDHVKPLAKGGWHTLANLRPICRRCNLVKAAKWPIDINALRQVI